MTQHAHRVHLLAVDQYHSVATFLLMQNAVFLLGSAAADVTASAGKLFNIATRTSPCVIHANGWEKMPLIKLVLDAGEITESERDTLLETKSTFEKTKVCIVICRQ